MSDMNKQGVSATMPGKKVAVIAGTPVDTQMGVDYLNKRGGFEPLFLPAFDEPRTCHVFQMQDQIQKEKVMKALFIKGLGMGAGSFFIYCNSLSGAFDYDEFGKQMKVNTVTPLNAYARLAKDYKRVGVIAANASGLAGIERAFTNANEGCYVYGTGLLDMVEAIESKEAPADICERFRLGELFSYLKGLGAEAIVLGCTHFPYIKEEAAKLTELPIIDPADVMYSVLCGQ